jgi:3-methyladenine DNA glycosylase AlkD
MSTQARQSGKSSRLAPAKSAPGKAAKASQPRMTLEQAMAALEQAGSEQTRKTYRRHGVSAPMFGVSFATLKSLLKAIGVDHELAVQLWDTGNYDACNLALKIADPAQMTPADLDHWARSSAQANCASYVANLATEGPHGLECAQRWLASENDAERAAGWSTVGALAMTDASIPDDWFLARLIDIEHRIHSAANALRTPMNNALIAIGCRNAALHSAAGMAAKRIGKVDIDHGDTACKTPDAASSMDKAWAHSTGKGFESPAAHERSRESVRLRC